MAIGSLVEFWRLAQEYYVRGQKVVPHDIFKAFDIPEAIVNAGFAIVQEDGVHACGAKEQFAWIAKRKQAGRRGGIASGRSRQTKAKTIPIDKPRSNRQANVKQDASKTNPLTLTHSLTLTQSPLIQGATALQSAPAHFKNPVAIWCEEYTRTYGTLYEVMGRDGGMLKGFAKTRSEEKMRTLFSCYLAIKDPLYVAQRHPLSLFFRDLPKVVNASQTGVDPSKPAPFDYSKLKD